MTDNGDYGTATERRHRRVWRVCRPTPDGSPLYAVTCFDCRYQPPASFGRPEWARQFYDRAHQEARAVEQSSG